MNDDFSQQWDKIPFCYALEAYKDIVFQEFGSVKSIDVEASRTKYIRKELGQDKMELLLGEMRSRPDGWIVPGEYESEAIDKGIEFDKILLSGDLPDKYKVNDIKETPTCKTLLEIKKLVDEISDERQRNGKFFDKVALFNKVRDLIALLPSGMDLAVINKIGDTKLIESFEIITGKERTEEKHLVRSLGYYLKRRVDEALRGEDIVNAKNTNINMAIDKEELGKYFKSQFKGMGRYYNYLDTFINHLQTPRNAKDFARIALLCHEGSQMGSLKPNTFIEWHKVFCTIIGCEYVRYDINKLHDGKYENLKNTFSYLE